jgi:hypothetical protein
MEKKAKAEAKRIRRIKRKQEGDVSNLQEPQSFEPQDAERQPQEESN